MSEKVVKEFGNKIRLRVCGLCFTGDEILLVNHKGIYAHDFWAPPGGGVEFGESAENALKREFQEECNVKIKVKNFLFGCEFIHVPFHAVELFFETELLGSPVLGIDPEMADNQIISEVRFMKPKVLRSIPRVQRHGIFQKVENPISLLDLRGFFILT